MPDTNRESSARAEEFARQGAAKPASLLSEYVHFAKTTGKWWMLALIVALSIFGSLLVLASTGAAPFIYTLF